MATVGFIGLGTMGRPMARNLLKAGHKLVFFARRAAVAEEFISAGGVWCESPAEVARAAELVITIVPADAEVREVVLGPRGVLEGLAPGKLLIDMSTISPATARHVAARLEAAGAAMLDAPVSGGPWGAEAGTLSIMVGGDAAQVERARPVFDALGKNVFHVGPIGAGQTVKLANQMVAGGIMALVAEAFVLARKAGIDPTALANVMSVSSGNSAMLEARGKRYVLADKYDAGFSTELMRKDMLLALELAQGHQVPAPVASSALQQYTAAMNAGLGGLDFAAIVKICERAAGTKVVG